MKSAEYEMNKNDFLRLLKKVLEKYNFKKRGSDFYLIGPKDLLVIIHLQKSAYGNIYYLNVCFSLIEYDESNKANIPNWRDTDTYNRVKNISESNYCFDYDNIVVSDDFVVSNLEESIDAAMMEWIIPTLDNGSDYVIENVDFFSDLSNRFKIKREEFLNGRL